MQVIEKCPRGVAESLNLDRIPMHLTRTIRGLSACLPVLFTWTESSGAQIPPPEAGMRVIRYTAAARPEAEWSVGAPVLTIGTVSGATNEHVFHNVAGAVLIGSDRVAVGDGSSNELRFFAISTGRHLRTAGGQGRGPGEISELWDVWRTPDAVVAVDASGRASHFDQHGMYSRSVPPPVDILDFRLTRVGYFDDGSGLAFATERTPDGAADGLATVWMRIVTFEGDDPRLAMRYPHHLITRNGTAGSWGLVFGPTSALAAIGNRFCVGFPLDYVIDCYSQEGRPLYRIMRDSWTRVSVTSRHRADYFSVNEAANPGPRGRPYIEFLRQNARFAEHFPAFECFVAAATGDLWVGPFVPEGDTPVLKPFPLDPTTWSVYSPDGRWLSEVELPARFRLFSVGVDHVVGVMRDENDVESITILPLRTH